MRGKLSLLAIVISAIVNLAAGFVWFNILFRDAYIANLQRTPEQMAAGPSGLVASIYQFVGFLVLAAGLDWLMRRTGRVGAKDGLTLGAISWACFFAAVLGPMYAYQAFSLALFGIVAGGYLINFLIAGGLIGALKR